jgi:DNA mismatch repair protein MutS
MHTDIENLTPAMKQYKKVKEKYPDCVVFFRMGDFYEMFFEDAKTASRALNITLTKRAGAPLAGIPWKNLDTYLDRMIKQGYKVAICEQMEDPRTVKGRVVDRDVVRIVTPGTVTSTEMLDNKTNNFLMSVVEQDRRIGIAVADISTGEFMATELNSREQLNNEIARFSPAEIIIPENYSVETEIYKTKFEERFFSFENAYKELVQHFNAINLQGYGLEQKEKAVMAAGALLRYLNETQKNSTKQITKIRYFETGNHMILDRSTVRNLELVRNIMDGTARGSLLGAVDRTSTSMGSRLLRKWLLNPLLDIAQINKRLDAVHELSRNTLLREELKEILNNINDVERLITKISNNTANARDLVALKKSLADVPKIKNLLKETKSLMFKKICQMKELKDEIELIEKSIKENPSAKLTEGGMIRKGCHKELDELREIAHGGKDWIAKLESEEKSKTGISTLRVGFNKVHGYYVEVTKKHSDSVPASYIRKQTLVNAERYITPELKEKEASILGAEDKINMLEYEIFQELAKKISGKIREIQEIGENVAVLDALISFAVSSIENNYSRPELTDRPLLDIAEGRHPVVELLQKEPFIPNNAKLNNEERLLIITGPNMAGKSCYMRQIAVIQLLSQIGCFVPAKSAKIGIVDRIFTRVGAYDDLTMGQSTFMVEMNETANILNNATSKSLVILDEIGRGTSTYDGISIAWAVAEYIYEKIGARTLFATHFHQLNKLADKFEKVKNYNIAVKETKDAIIFLRKIIKGGTDKSYGIQVARLAGLPKEVIEKSMKIMSQLEMEDEIADRIHKPLKKPKEPEFEKEKAKEEKKQDFTLSKFI